MIQSTHRHTLNGAVLLDFGERMMAEPSYPLAAEVQESRFVGARWGKARGRGNLLRTFSWTRVLTFGSLAEMQTRKLQLPASYLALPAGELLIEVENGGATRVHDFALSTVTAEQRWEKNALDLLLTFEGIGGREEVVSSGGFGETWDPDDGTTWDNADSSKWQLI